MDETGKTGTFHTLKETEGSELPDDLKYVTLVESALRPYAVSPRGQEDLQVYPCDREKYEMRKNRIVMNGSTFQSH